MGTVAGAAGSHPGVGTMDVTELGFLPLEECPACGGADLEAVSDGEMTNFWCPACAACWHVTMGRVVRVDPLACPGCPHREHCLRAAGPDGEPVRPE